jgi:hypothetical protein
MFCFLRQASGQEVDLGELMKRKDLTLSEIKAIAENHFKVAGKGKGTGFKVFQRWLYEQKFHLDDNGYIKNPEKEFLAYQVAKRSLTENNQGERTFLNWTELGPQTWQATSGQTPGIGRLTSIAIHPSNETVIYVSSPGGGIWKSTNAGATWSPLIDLVNSAWMDVYNLCITPNNQNVIYAGITYGGVIKSNNSGMTWTAAGNGPYDVRKIIVHPSNASIVLLIASNGVWRSTNAGNSWTLVNSTINGNDIEFKANDPNIVLASFNSNMILRSTNNGVNWTSVSLTGTGRTMIGVSPANSNIIYAVQANGSVFGNFYKSTDAGVTFTSIITGSSANGTNFFGYEANGTGTTGQAWYDMAICVNPTNINEVHIAGIICWKSMNQGASFTAETEWYYPNSTGYNHADIHSLEFINSTLYSGSDGGIYKSTNNGDDWTDLSAGLGIRQFYRIACAKTNANIIVGGAQDNGTTYRQNTGNWIEWLGGDGTDAIISPSNANIVIGSSQNGSIYKTTNAGTSYINLTKPSNGNWVTPLVMHPTSQDTIYGGWTGIYRSDNGGTNWNIISGNTIVDMLECLAIAPSNTKFIYGSVEATIYRTSNGGATWSSITAPGNVTSIFISPNNPQKVWITTSNTSNNVLVSTNMGSSWTNISTGLPSIPARSIVVDNTPNEGVYVGMNIGVYYKDNINPAWIIHGNGLPLVEINEVELQLSSKKVRVATYGRGIWESNMQVPSSVYAGSDVTINCSTPSTTLTAFGGTSYIWNTGETTASITVSPILTTIYTVTATMSGGNITSDTVIVTVNKTVPIANAGMDVTVTCQNPSTTLTATGGGSYLWSNNATTANNSVNPIVTTIYSVTVTGNNGCTVSDEVLVTVYKIIPTANAGSDITILTNSSATLNATGGINFLWSNGATSASIIVSPTTTTTYVVTVTNASGCTALDAVIVTVIPICVVLSFSNAAINENKFRVSLRANSCFASFGMGTNNLRINYNKMALSNPIVVSEVFPSPDFSTTTTSGSVTSNGILSISTTYTGIANANNLPITTAGTDLVNLEFDIINSSLTTGLSWRISGSNPKVSIIDDDKITNINNITGTNLDASLQGINAGDDITLNCVKPSGTLTATGGLNYIWSTGETTASITVSPIITTAYSVSATNNNITAFDKVIVSADKAPPIADAGADITLNCPNLSTVLNASGGQSYFWSSGQTTSNIAIYTSETKVYSVTVTAANQCTATDNVVVTIAPCLLKLSAKVYLNNLNTSTLVMDNYLTTLASFPLTDPYSNSPLNTNFIHVNNYTIATISPTLLNTIGNDAIIDWVFLELRTGQSGSTSVAFTKAALLQRDGDIVSTDGISPVTFNGIPAGSFYITVRHRNNLGFRTANPFYLSNTTTFLDFTNNSVPLFGSDPLVSLSPALYVMNSGDSTSDGSIDAFDSISWESENGLFDNYLNKSDYNQDGSIDAFDSILWELNNGKFQVLD